MTAETFDADAVGTPGAADRDGDLVAAGPVAPSRRRTEKAKAARGRTKPRTRRRRFSKLTLRVLAINLLALVILVFGLLFLGRYEEQLLQAELDAITTEARIFAGAIAEGATEESVAGGTATLIFDRANVMVRRLHESTDTRIRLFDGDGSLIADSRQLGGPGTGGVVEIEPLPQPVEEPSMIGRWYDQAYGLVLGMLPPRKRWPTYSEQPEQRAEQYPPAIQALRGSERRQIWSTGERYQIVGAGVPVQRLRQVIGSILVTRTTEPVEQAMQDVRASILAVFAVSVGITILASLYLAGTITRPIRRLAAAAEQVRRGAGREMTIPDFTKRRDEIGELSHSLRSMTAALWNRMDAIESFAADVSHEIKNPLTSLRSAVETTARVKDPEQQKRLMSIILEDVQRLDRLITDISDASRLDAELSRSKAEVVDLERMLSALKELYTATLERDERGVRLVVEATGPLNVVGLETRLVQVLRNLIGNAMTFSPEGGVIRVIARRRSGRVTIQVIDDGPGIPDSKLEAIFDRFYSERPAAEKFGTHSGLGLSISRQIVEAHGGTITADNRTDKSGAVFTVTIPAR